MSAAHLENLRYPMAVDVREICLLYHSNGECFRQHTHSQAPLRVHIRNNLIRFIINCRATFCISRKRKFNGGGDQGSYVGGEVGIGTVLADTTGRTQMYRLVGTALEVVSVEAAKLEGLNRTGITAESEVCNGAQVTTPTPSTRTDRCSGVVVRTAWREGGQRRGILIGGGGGSRSCGVT